MDAITDKLASSLAEELALPATPADEIERMADVHRRAVASYMKRAADARRRGKMLLIELEDERRRLIHIHKEEMARIDAEAAGVKSQTAGEIAASDKLAAVSRAALEALAA